MQSSARDSNPARAIGRSRPRTEKFCASETFAPLARRVLPPFERPPGCISRTNARFRVAVARHRDGRGDQNHSGDHRCERRHADDYVARDEERDQKHQSRDEQSGPEPSPDRRRQRPAGPKSPRERRILLEEVSFDFFEDAPFTLRKGHHSIIGRRRVMPASFFSPALIEQRCRTHRVVSEATSNGVDRPGRVGPAGPVCFGEDAQLAARRPGSKRGDRHSEKTNARPVGVE